MIDQQVDARRFDWSREEVAAIYDTPLLELIFRAGGVHREFHDPAEVQVCQLISIKTGGCPEDCGYCSQSAHHATGVESTPLLENDDVVERARRAKASGATRVCLGAAWREVRDGPQFERVLGMVREIAAMNMEVCCTLGMLNATQAQRLADAGLFAYNHNLDTSAEHYNKVITTRTHADRLNTIRNVRQTSVTVCCGGILGLGESETDRVSFLHTLATLQPHPESVPINVLSKVDGTPLANAADVSVFDTVRVIATARILMPRSQVRLSAGRAKMSESDQALCFLAGANSIFSSETGTMLTSKVPTQNYGSDQQMLETLGLRSKPATRNRCATASS